MRARARSSKKLRPNGTLRLFGLNASVREVFDVSGFATIIPIFDDRAAALAG
jgi:anti-anti-sigma regulatory factor